MNLRKPSKPKSLFFFAFFITLGLMACRYTYTIEINGDTRIPGLTTSSKVVADVPATTQWYPSGLVVKEGDTLVIQYVSGVWSPWPGGNYDALGSGGDPRCTCNVILGVSHAALIAKIGNNQPFFVGNEFRHRVGERGMVYLGINDNHLSDNSGSLIVKLEALR
ncbi:MAG: hypothetical protein ACPL3P_09345 [Anaerolineales bacterium]